MIVARTVIIVNVQRAEVLSESAVAIYENVKTGVNDVLALNESDYATRDEYIAAVSTELDETLKANDIKLDEATLETMSNYIADNYSDVDEITDEDINRALLSYYSSFANGEGTPKACPRVFLRALPKFLCNKNAGFPIKNSIERGTVFIFTIPLFS